MQSHNDPRKCRSVYHQNVKRDRDENTTCDMARQKIVQQPISPEPILINRRPRYASSSSSSISVRSFQIIKRKVSKMWYVVARKDRERGKLEREWESRRWEDGIDDRRWEGKNCYELNPRYGIERRSYYR